MKTWTFVWMNTLPATAWHGDPVACWTQIVAAYLAAASDSHVQVVGEPTVQVGEDDSLPAGLLKVVVSSPAYAMPARIDTTAPDVPCEQCGATALSGGRWCLRCFQTHATPRPRTGCGTSAGYTAHRRAGTDACRACKDAHSQARRRSA